MEKGPFKKLLVLLIILEHHLKVSPDVATLLHGTRDSALMEHCSMLLQVHPTVSGSSDTWKHTLRTQPSCSPHVIERGCNRMDSLPLLMQSLEFFLVWTNASVPPIRSKRALGPMLLGPKLHHMDLIPMSFLNLGHGESFPCFALGRFECKELLDTSNTG